MTTFAPQRANCFSQRTTDTAGRTGDNDYLVGEIQHPFFLRR